MSIQASSGTIPDHRSLAEALVPALRRSCDDRLGKITWFKADWQRGGAATGTSRFRREDGTEIEVVLKLPVVGRELVWMRRLQDDDPDPVVPRLLASGEAINGYDLTWLIMERFPYGPLGLRWHDQHVPRIASAAARLQGLAARYPVDEPPKRENWDELLAESLESVRVNLLEDPHRWSKAIKTLRQRLDELQSEWRSRETGQWLHGDLHFANAMSRTSMRDGPVSLIDLAEIHAGNWIEDAVYLERQLWARPERLKPARPVKAVATARRELGLPVEKNYPRLAMIRRVLLAASAPRFIRSEGHPKHLEACLDWMDRGLADLK